LNSDLDELKCTYRLRHDMAQQVKRGQVGFDCGRNEEKGVRLYVGNRSYVTWIGFPAIASSASVGKDCSELVIENPIYQAALVYLSEGLQ
jgi:hypothetical protein